MNDQFFTDLVPVTAAATKRTQDLIEGLIPNLKIDWATGRSRVENSDRLVAEFRRTGNSSLDSDALAQSFLGILNDGFAVPQNTISPEDARFRPIPWRSLFHMPSLSSMTLKDWDWLGIGENSTVSEIDTSICHFSYYPDYVVSEPYLENLASSAAFYIPQLRVPVQYPPAVFLCIPPCF
jgi:hypothetical protein